MRDLLVLCAFVVAFFLVRGGKRRDRATERSGAINAMASGSDVKFPRAPRGRRRFRRGGLR